MEKWVNHDTQKSKEKINPVCDVSSDVEPFLQGNH